MRTIVEELLDREQRKFVKQARVVLHASSDAAWDELYDREVQLSRVLSRTAGAALPVTRLPSGFSQELIGAYRLLLDTTLPNHPFLGSSSFVNVVMRDFTYAWAMDHDDPAVVDTVSRLVGDASYQVSPVLGRFYLSTANSAEPIPTCFPGKLLCC